MCVDPVLLVQFVRASLFHHDTVLKDNDLIGARDRSHPAGDNQHSLIADQSGERRLNECFVFLVKARGRLVKKDDRGILQKRTCNKGSSQPPLGARLPASLQCLLR